MVYGLAGFMAYQGLGFDLLGFWVQGLGLSRV